MRLATVNLNLTETASIVTSAGVLPIYKINRQLGKNWNTELLEIITTGQLNEINDWHRSVGKNEIEKLKSHIIPFRKIKFAPPYRHPRKIWGIGLNYVEHAKDLLVKTPLAEPASFMKPDTTIIGYKDIIRIPVQSIKTTGESELGIIIGKKCKDIETEDWLKVVAGFTPIIDMTAEDLLRKNLRYLTRAKSFDTFFSFGPHIVTPDEIEDIMKLQVATVINGEIYAENIISNMTFPPDFLVSFHSKVMTLLPGDIIATGTPRAVQLHTGDIIECRIDGFTSLKNSVIDLKDRQ
ncbi:fumarylacetoacetate hydrolase [Candidatus Heimdallarchaeota archaeon B3_Heim]|nr:MAG: fumarylacetoacetate hydrolase [Candidatus Heimdallarchaeota archaeon B3_Heim]